MHKRKLLLVEKSPIDAELLSLSLQEEYEVARAQDGRQGFALLRQAHGGIDLVLLDLTTQESGGYEFLEQVRREPSLARIPVIAVTRQDSQEEAEQALALGAAEVLAKPCGPLLLRRKVESVIRLRESGGRQEPDQEDELTGLLKREVFCQKAEELLRENPEETYTVFCFDLENFKLVNDLAGRTAGDRLLQCAAGILKEQIPEGGLCGRLRADTFAILAPSRVQYGEEEFRRANERLNGLGMNVRLSLRVGIYKIEERDLPMSTVCDRAILAADSIRGWYGKRFAVYNDEIRQNLLREKSLIDGMEQALSEKQFEVWYQPRYCLRTGQIVAAEALVRWRHPQKGLLHPDEFISLFERTGLIDKLDLYVWEQACADTARWEKQGCPALPVSVNVSRADLYDPELPGRLGEILRRYSLPASRLHLEITETVCAKEPHQIVEAAKRLKQAGFVLEMDDFGSAYSSLNMLNELPIDLLKLDMKFLRHEKNPGRDRNILYFIIDLARWMRLPVTAEGVETREQADWLRGIGCDCGQGYFFSRPLPEKEYLQLLRRCKEEASVRQQNSAPEPEDGEGDTHRPTLLILEREEVYRQLQQRVLGRRYHLVWKESSEEILQALARPDHAVQMVLLDMAVIRADAGRTLQLIRKEPALQDLPVLVSGPFAPGAEETLLQMGADDFLAKPYNDTPLLHHVQGVLARRRFSYSRSEESEEQRRLEDAANRDYLTGVLNRRGLDQAVEQMELEGRQGMNALYVLDLDDLKGTNDRHGHFYGDKKLRAFADYLTSCLRAEDLVARIGGDEFIILMRQIPSAEVARQQGQRLCRDLERKSGVDGEKISCSAGVAIFRGMAELQQALVRADQALYQAKRQGKGRCCLWQPESPA